MVFDWFRKKDTVNKQCDHEYFISPNSYTNGINELVYNHLLTCIHCGHSVDSRETIPNPIDTKINDAKAIHEYYKIPILTRIYGKYKIVNKLTKLM